ncbi:phage virion morphogenesis protein [Pantoea eucrina]|uniref:phage virion morphogenesis protein n=1 Tax=Pantoea eucrina TaxID=472693 RepID=UPI0024B67198|nr:phage virion morphogenesis protein [Pantoea eucrina]MDJ0025137.1 phage virion morphogenesis protein [Pantoea eucrina]
MSGLQLFDDRLSALINNLSPAARKEMARTIAKKLRASQQQNIKSQRAPDGTPFKPRRAEAARNKQGRVKREMFAKLRTAKYMKATATDSEAVVGFVGKVQRMARVHHYGLRERASKFGGILKYEERPLLGLNKHALLVIETVVLDFFKKAP